MSAMSEQIPNDSFMFAIGEAQQRKKVTYAPAVSADADVIGALNADGYIMIDSGACDSACVPDAFDAPIDTSRRKRLFAINSTEIKVHGRQQARCQVGSNTQHAAMFEFNVTDCSKNVLSVSNIVD